MKEEIWQLIEELFPICRSLTGNGVRQTLDILKKHIPLVVHEIASGTEAFDWIVPDEWNITDAYIKDPQGRRLVDFRKNNLHVVSYSVPFEGVLTREELESHLHSLPEQPEAIPYVTSYYQPYWGFCLSQRAKDQLRSDISYHVKIDSALKPGSLTFGDLLIKGKSSKEILISCYICHPSMANDSLSGIAIAVFLAKALLDYQNDLTYSYRFVFIPETIGSIVYLSLHKEELRKNVIAGYVATCLGDPHPFSYLHSRTENSLSDRIALHLLKRSHATFTLYSFLERGSDERQYCSPGIDLPIGSLMRSKYGTYKEYHTSLDNLNFITADALHESLTMYKQCLKALDHNHVYKNVCCCEPQLGRRGLYPNLGTSSSAKNCRLMMNFLAYADGKQDLLSIAEKVNCSILDLIPLASLLLAHHLIEKC